MEYQNQRNYRFFKTLLLMPTILLTVVLSACNTAKFDELTTGGIPDDYRTRHPITVQETEQSVSIPIASTDRKMSISQRDAVRGFVSNYKTRASGIIYIFSPVGSKNSLSAKNIRQEIRAELIAQEIPQSKIIDSEYAAQKEDAAPIRLSFFGMNAITNECGRWPANIYHDDKNQNYYNFGCAVQNNLAAQIADPNDFIAPRGMTPPDAAQRNNTIKLYRQQVYEYTPAEIVDYNQ